MTGAFGYTGSYIAERLLASGRPVRTLTRRSPGGHALAGRIDAHAMQFEDEAALVAAMRGVDTLYNTYWRRFPRPDVGFADMVARSEVLLGAARKAGVRRIVHFSVSNASDDAPTSYFRAKAQVERAVRACGVSAVIVRPTLLCGPGDILLNNLAWTLRRFPLFGMPGDGSYPVQPVLVTDVADLAVRVAESSGDDIVTAAGPDTYRFVDLVRLIRESIGSSARIVGVPPMVALAVSGLIGRVVHDVVLTRDEVTELMAGLLVSREPATCPTSIRDWLATERSSLGRRYTSEIARNYPRA